MDQPVRLLALFNLRPGVAVETYERWAREKDIPTVQALPSVANFEVRRVTEALGGGAAPYTYVETIDVSDMVAFGREIAEPRMQAIAEEFQAMVEVSFLVTQPL